MNPANTLNRLKRAQAQLQAVNATAAEKAAVIAEKERTEAAVIAQIEADERAAARAEQDIVDAAHAEVAKLQAQLEAERIAALWAIVNADPALADVWDRAELDAARLDAAPHGAEGIRVRAELALRRSTGITVTAELWHADTNQMASVTVAGLTFRSNRYTSDVAAAAGFMDLITIQTPGGWVPVFSVHDLARVVRENPAMRDAK